MSNPPDVSFAPESDLPAIRARLDVLLLIGRAARLYFPGLQDACDANGPPTWDEILHTLAEILFREMTRKNITGIVHAVDVWAEFERSLTVRKLSNSGRLAIHRMGQYVSDHAILGRAGIGLSILAHANTLATLWLQRHILPHVEYGNLTAAPVVVEYDEAGTQFCAASTPSMWQVRWTLQPFEHSFYGAMILPRVFEHEYLSHLIPLNRHLSKGVREVFLIDTLEHEHRNDAAQNPREKNADIKLAAWFRVKLEDHFCRNGLTSRAELRDFEDIATLMRRKSEPDFWRMLDNLLTYPNHEWNARRVDEALKLLRYASDEKFDNLAIPWNGFEAVL